MIGFNIKLKKPPLCINISLRFLLDRRLLDSSLRCFLYRDNFDFWTRDNGTFPFTTLAAHSHKLLINWGSACCRKAFRCLGEHFDKKSISRAWFLKRRDGGAMSAFQIKNEGLRSVCLCFISLCLFPSIIWVRMHTASHVEKCLYEYENPRACKALNR